MDVTRGHVSMEIKQTGGKWLGASRLRLWSDQLTEPEQYEDWGLSFITFYRLHLLGLTLLFQFPAFLVNTLHKLKVAR